MTVGFHWLDKHVQKRIESQAHGRALIDVTRMLAYPPQCLASVARLRRPWFREDRR